MKNACPYEPDQPEVEFPEMETHASSGRSTWSLESSQARRRGAPGRCWNSPVRISWMTGGFQRHCWLYWSEVDHAGRCASRCQEAGELNTGPLLAASAIRPGLSSSETLDSEPKAILR